MSNHDLSPSPATGATWQDQVLNVLKDHGVSLISYVPDAGHAAAIRGAIADPDIEAVSLTTEEEGIAVNAGAWLGGRRAALLMQSSGVGNCVNMLSLIQICRFPLLTIVTMRGEWNEFNPWQVPMGAGTPAAFELMGVRVLRAEHADDVAPTIASAANLAFLASIPCAVLISQRVIGSKVWTK